MYTSSDNDSESRASQNFGATCLTQYSHQNGQGQLCWDFQKASLKPPRFSAVFLYAVKAIGDRGDPLKLAKSKCLKTCGFSS